MVRVWSSNDGHVCSKVAVPYLHKFFFLCDPPVLKLRSSHGTRLESWREFRHGELIQPRVILGSG